MAIDKRTAEQIGREVAEALQAVAERHGLTVAVRGGTYDTTGLYRPKVEFKTADADREEFARYASMFGLEADDFGKTFTSNGREFRVSGVAPRSPKRPILAVEVATGKTYKFADAAVKMALRSAS